MKGPCAWGGKAGKSSYYCFISSSVQVAEALGIMSSGNLLFRSASIS